MSEPGSDAAAIGGRGETSSFHYGTSGRASATGGGGGEFSLPVIHECVWDVVAAQQLPVRVPFAQATTSVVTRCRICHAIGNQVIIGVFSKEDLT